MKFIQVGYILLLFISGCSSTQMDPSAYNRQNSASEQSLKSLDLE